MDEELIKNILDLLKRELSLNDILSSLPVNEEVLKTYLRFLLVKKFVKHSYNKFKITSKGKEALKLKNKYATDFNFGVNLGFFKAEIKKRQII